MQRQFFHYNEVEKRILNKVVICARLTSFHLLCIKMDFAILLFALEQYSQLKWEI